MSFCGGGHRRCRGAVTLAGVVAYRGIIPDGYIAGITHESRLSYWEDVLGKDDLAVFVAVDDIGGVLGWAATGRDREEPGVATITEIQAMYVHPEYPRNGIGGLLLEHIFE
ncbi:MAG: GNAT family N-acetyltransferase [Paraburkholderia tropica]|uniref:GNAT family N-acetyltransferase n=1 Tax=Burkholderia gladioli TaxID=28095 RepID=UPI00163F1588|nr:GNAT family N-acetyltransferase [Burkholderia gladioli]MDN7499962.1 GNAT family N-acetyltransferase [Burkholderia gladioli]